MNYVYLIESMTIPGERYVGVTKDLKRRLQDHATGKSLHTSKFMPWRLVTYVAFADPGKAESFEQYIESGSGHAFAKKTPVVACGQVKRAAGAPELTYN